MPTQEELDRMAERQAARLAARVPVPKDPEPPPKVAPKPQPLVEPTEAIPASEFGVLAERLAQIFQRSPTATITANAGALVIGALLVTEKAVMEGTICPSCLSVDLQGLKECAHPWHGERSSP